MAFNAKHAVTRDLVWAISSPPLLTAVSNSCHWHPAAWYQSLARSSQALFSQIDDSPDELEARVAAQNDRRLGRYFETLWAYWLEKHPRYHLLAHNVPIMDGDRTLGELDFIVRDRASGETLHWELAVKFYLGAGDTRDRACWHGPGQKDRLDRKVDHLAGRQSVLAAHPQAREQLARQGIDIDGCGIIMKGRLFYPGCAGSLQAAPAGACAEHLRSRWCTLSAFTREWAGHRFVALVGRGWMAELPVTTEHSLSAGELADAVNQGRYRLPLQAMCLNKNTNNFRLFIVKDDWI